LTRLLVSNFQSGLATHFGIATSVDDNLHLVTTAGPGVGSNLTAEQAATPANGRCFSAATWNADTDFLRAAAARRLNTENGLDWGWCAAAASVATCKAVVGHTNHGGQGDCGYSRNSTNTKHVSFPSVRQKKRYPRQLTIHCRYSVILNSNILPEQCKFRHFLRVFLAKNVAKKHPLSPN
jgi:hypothetical protein